MRRGGDRRACPGLRETAIRRARQRGVVLIIVLLMITLIMAVTVQMVRASRLGYYEAANMRDLLKAGYLAKSGFYRGQALMDEDDNDYDALFEKWAQSDVISAPAASMFDEGYFTLVIEDESGRLNINRLVGERGFNEPVKGVLVRLLSLPAFGLESQQVMAIVNAIKDYLDVDSEATGAEKGTPEPTGYKNGSLDSLEELLTIPGISQELFFGTQEHPGLSKYLTIYGDGRININTAPRQILQSLAERMTEDQAAAMETFRRRSSAELGDPGWYRNVPGMAGVMIDGTLIKTRSEVFRITSTGWLNKMSQQVTGIVQRGRTPDETSKILLWKVH